MSETAATKNLTISSGGRTWLVLQQHLDAYLAERDRQGQSPNLAAFLPAQPDSLRRLVLIELIKVDLDYRWRQCHEKRFIEDYFRDYPELQGEPPPCDLIYEEFHVRKRAGEPVEPAEYLERFPDQAGQLRALLGNAPTVTSSFQTAPDLTSLSPGQKLDDFELLARLGTGAFGVVFLARQQSMQRLVALKVSATRAADPETLAQLDHPCIVRVYDQKQLTDSGLYLMYMQYVPGGTLQGVIDRLNRTAPDQRTGRLLLRTIDANLEGRGEVPPAESSLRNRLAGMSWPEVVCWLGARLAEALDHAHAHHVLHRDVKPANVLLSAEGLPRLADFNVGCCTKVEGAGPSAFFGGSLPYMSPEQLEVLNPANSRAIESLDGRSDLYSLGVLLWELLTGALPFADQDVPANWSALLERLLEERKAWGKSSQRSTRTAPRGTDTTSPVRAPDTTRQVLQAVPGLEETLRTCLAPDPDKRYQSGRELAAQLDLCLKPRARELLHSSGRGWQALVRRFPIAAIVLVALVVNGVMAVFNFVYNGEEIIAKGQLHKETFLFTQAIINGVTFPLGIALFLRLGWPLSRGLKRLRAGQTLSAGYLRELRQLCLPLGKHGADICLTCWLLAGFAYPLAMNAALDPVVFVHFFASLTLCGLVAAAYPFFISTFLAVRVFYPLLLRPGTTVPTEVKELRQVKRWLAVYLMLAACVPLLALTILSVFKDSGSKVLQVILGAGGLVGFVAMFALAGVIRADLEALESVVSGD